MVITESTPIGLLSKLFRVLELKFATENVNGSYLRSKLPVGISRKVPQADVI